MSYSCREWLDRYAGTTLIKYPRGNFTCCPWKQHDLSEQTQFPTGDNNRSFNNKVEKIGC